MEDNNRTEELLPEFQKNQGDSDNNELKDLILALKSYYQRILENRKLFGILRTIFFSLIAFASIVFLFVVFAYFIPAMQEIPRVGNVAITNNAELKKDASYKKQNTQMSREVQRLSKKYSSYTSGQSYLVINTTDNLFYLYRNKKLIREGHCSTGSFKMLKTEEGRSWIFKTPKGKFLIQGKTTNPSWRRPDWAFVEEGLPIPSEDDASRYEYGVLGDYALALGDGYLIHGTIYKRFLGMPVTHGCVRLNDEDLKAIFNTLSIGSKVYIF
jgi:lipoprotein-anchoring transpeptidase ErfK/SrfK